MILGEDNPTSFPQSKEEVHFGHVELETSMGDPGDIKQGDDEMRLDFRRKIKAMNLSIYLLKISVSFSLTLSLSASVFASIYLCLSLSKLST